MPKTKEPFHDPLAKLAKVIEDYYDGIKLIDREFDAARERINQSIANARGESAKLDEHYKSELSQDWKLHNELEKMECDITEAEVEIRKKTQGIAAVNAVIEEIKQDITSLKEKIQKRQLIEKIYWFLYQGIAAIIAVIKKIREDKTTNKGKTQKRHRGVRGPKPKAQDKTSNREKIQKLRLTEGGYMVLFQELDPDKKQYDKLQISINNRLEKKSELEKIKRGFELTKLQLVSKKNGFQTLLAEFQHKLAGLKKSADYAHEQERIFASKRIEAESSRKMRKQNIWTVISAKWEIASKETNQGMEWIFQQQPTFIDLFTESSSIVIKMPDFLLLGSQQVSFKELCCLVPHVISFPFEHALVLSEDNAAQRRLVHHLLLRLLQSIPPGRLELTLVDPLKLGQSFAPFLPLLNVEQLMPNQRVLTRADEIELALGKLTDETEDLIQHRFKGRISNWSEFNATNSDSPLRYKIVLLFDVPQQLSDKSLWYLQRLAENGPRCGMLPIIAIDSELIEDSRYEKIRASLKSSTQRLNALLRATDYFGDGLGLLYEPEEWPKQEVLDKFLSARAVLYSEMTRFSKTLPDLWVGYANDATTIGGFDIPIGWTPSGEIVHLTLGSTGSEHHALLAGKTGTGKSNLLHVMIHSLCEKYAPQEIDLYLLDYKESTEFMIYSNPALPHAQLVATESDSEYGVTVLQHLVDELESRARIFKSEGVHDFAEYRNTQRNQLPRVLLVIDEFQVLFAEGRQVAEMAEKLLLQLLKQGRSFGIHLLLATQTLKGLNALSLGSLVSQLGCRIALACSLEDSAIILSGSNWAASELKSPPEAIINNANGAKSGNVKFLIPLAESAYCRNHLAQLSERAMKSLSKNKTRIFNGANLPSRPTRNEFQVLCGEGDQLLLGERLTFITDALSIPLIKRQGFNVLFSGYNDLIHDGLLSATLTSLSCGVEFDEIVYFNGRGIAPSGDFANISSELGERFKVYNDISALPMQHIADNIGKRRVALIIDGLDAEKALHPIQFKTLKPGEPLTPADLLKRIADDGSRKGTFVFAFIDNWRRFAVPCKDLLNFFELRVAFCMNEDDAFALVSGSIGKFKGIEKTNRAVFVNRMTNEIQWFRPYIAITTLDI